MINNNNNIVQITIIFNDSNNYNHDNITINRDASGRSLQESAAPRRGEVSSYYVIWYYTIAY